MHTVWSPSTTPDGRLRIHLQYQSESISQSESIRITIRINQNQPVNQNQNHNQNQSESQSIRITVKINQSESIKINQNPFTVSRNKSDRTTLGHSGTVKRSTRGISAKLQTSIGWVSWKVLVKVHFGVKVHFEVKYRHDRYFPYIGQKIGQIGEMTNRGTGREIPSSDMKS
jgi:hypothetical protein